MAGNRPMSVFAVKSTQEIRHQDNDGGDGDDHHLRYADESVVRLFVSGVIVAIRCRVLDFSVIGHRLSPNLDLAHRT
jgi:hypothetical protein